jgi:nucleotide-binding universal stress UspA family protein
MKTILVPTEDDDAMQSTLETALLLAQRCDSYLEGLALRWDIDESAAVDIGGGIPLQTYRQDVAEVERQARQIFESFMEKHHVPRSTSGPSAEQLFRYLQRNGVAAEPLTTELDGKNTGEVILATAKALGCDLLVKGAYTQSRLRQMIFGGATQHVMTNAHLPVLLAH